MSTTTLDGMKIDGALGARRLFNFAVALSALSALLLLSPLPSHAQTVARSSAAPIPARIINRVDNTVLAALPGSTHPTVRNAIDMGRLSPALAMTDLILVLRRSEDQQAALENFNQEQYDSNSPNYHRWLTPAQYGATYGVSDVDLQAVTNWLQNQGFTIDEDSPSRTSIRFSGYVAQVETAFHTEMHAINAGGVAHIANMSDISIPAALAPVVVGVKALHDFFPKPQHHALSRFAQNSSAGPTSAEGPASLSGDNQAGGPVPTVDGSSLRPTLGRDYAAGNGYQLLVPYDMATIYNYKSLWTASTPITGTGQTVAIAGTSNIVLSDIATFRSATGLPAKAPTVIVTNVDPGTTGLLDDRLENTLDVEWSGASAPGASIVLVTSGQTSQTTDALYASESYIINHSVAKVMSVSYGECELGMGTAGNQEYLNLWQQAYTQGIAVFVSSGDSMAAVCDDGDFNPSTDYATEFGESVSGMTSTPYNVSVGGTDFNSTSANWASTNSSTNLSNAIGYIPEVPWNDTVTNPILISDFNSQRGVNYSAEKWANWLLTTDGISSSIYQEVIPPTGGSGGVSSCTTSNGSTPSSCSGGYAKPSWQAGVTGILSSDKRTVPDVSLFASNGFLGVTYLICDSQPPGFSSPIACSYPANAMDMAVGGTSVSSPIMAGIMALINQKAGASQGNPNSVLYGLAARQPYGSCSAEAVANSGSCYFNDIDTGTIASACYGGTTNCTQQTSGDKLGVLPGYAATTGYDKATGLGSLNVANVVQAWPTGTTSSAPAAALSAASLTFASTKVGSAAATQSATLTNVGTAAMTISGISLTGSTSSFSQTNTCGSTLAVNAFCTVTVTFKPAAAGALSAALNFADNAANSTQTVALTGTGATASAASVTVSPTTLVFPATKAGSASASQTVTLTNTGSTTVTLTSSPTITGANATLFKGATSCSGSLAVKASCLTTFTFDPTAAGTFTATLSFNDNAPASPQTVSLSGTGTGVPVVSLSPASLTFAATTTGTSSVEQTVTLKNTGTGPLTISSLSITGASAAAFAQSSNCSTSLAAGASCPITVLFKPTTGGALSAVLSVADNATGSSQTIALAGTGIAPLPAASLSAVSLTFPVTPLSSSASAPSPVQAVTLTNTGKAALTIKSIALAGSSPTSFNQVNSCPSSLAVSASCKVVVTFAPKASGIKSATLVFTSNANPATQSVALTGTGASAPTLMPLVNALSHERRDQ
jgi:subtilase family serine protease